MRRGHFSCGSQSDGAEARHARLSLSRTKDRQSHLMRRGHFSRGSQYDSAEARHARPGGRGRGPEIANCGGDLGHFIIDLNSHLIPQNDKKKF